MSSKLRIYNDGSARPWVVVCPCGHRERWWRWSSAIVGARFHLLMPHNVIANLRRELAEQENDRKLVPFKK